MQTIRQLISKILFRRGTLKYKYSVFIVDFKAVHREKAFSMHPVFYKERGCGYDCSCLFVFMLGKKQAMIPISGNSVLIWKINSMLVRSANHPKNAEPKPPNPNINPKNIPAIIPTLSGMRSVAYTSMAEKAEAMTNPTTTARTSVHPKLV